MRKREVPGPVTLIALFYYIGAVMSLLIGILVLIGGGLAMIKLSLPISYAFQGILLIIVGIINLLIGNGLWTGRNWARILAIIFAFLDALFSLYKILTLEYPAGKVGIFISLMLGSIIIPYLLFNKKVKEAFS